MWYDLLRKLGLSLALSIVCVSAAAVACRADDSLKAALESRYAAMKAAMAARDSEAITAMLAPDFAAVDVFGQSKKASRVMLELAAVKPDPNKTREVTLIEVTPAGDSVTVQQRYHMKTVATEADGTQHSVELVTLSTDTWVKPGDTWLLQRTVTNELSMFRDGQMVMHEKKP